MHSPTYVAEMKRNGTLESPFRPGYLRRTLRQSGFTEVRRLAPIDRVFGARSILPARWHTLGRTLLPTHNMFVARAPAAQVSPDFAGELTVDAPRGDREGHVSFGLRVANRGRRYWPAGVGDPLPVGAVTIAPYLTSPSGERVELPRISLPRSLPPGEDLHLDAAVRLPHGPHDGLSLSLVREGIEWFAAPTTEPARVDLPTSRRS